MPHPRYVGLRLSYDAEAVPTTADIDVGELAINLATGRVYALLGEQVQDITDRYTRAETDLLLEGKAPSSHSHTLNQITDAGSAASANTGDFEPAGAAADAVAAHESADNPHAQYVQKVAGKGLSTEDYTADDKNKLAGVEAGAEVNPSIIDALNSDVAGQPLSANQGRVLKGLIDTINAVLQSDDGTLDELKEIVDYIKLNREELDSLSIVSIAGLQSALDSKQPLNSVLTATTASFTTALLSKLSSVESGATADQTKADIDALGIDADTLDGKHASDFDTAGSAAQAEHNLRETLRKRPDPLLMHFL